jgi:copper oxidase (laccase) domain-containing protein
VAAGILEAGVAAAVAAGARPESLAVVIGPGIGLCCFEVGPEVAARFDRESLRPGRSERPHVDLPHAARRALAQAGIPARAIAGGTTCTRCRSERYFSARSGEPTGRMVGFIVRSGGLARSRR